MKLLLDLGNSRLKWALVSGQQWLAQGVLAHRAQGFERALQAAWAALETPQQLVIASVAAAHTLAAVQAVAQQCWPDAEQLIARSAAQHGAVHNGYQQPEKLGVDRWLSLLAAHAHYPGDCLVVDCGTAITLDVLDASGLHQGGLICPGLQSMKTALYQQTADLPLQDWGETTGLADNTAAAIDSGIVLAAIGLIETVLARQTGCCRLVLTGGDAERLASQLSVRATVDNLLVLKGLLVCCVLEGV
jgi:type III pantothenate kinase